MPPAFGGGRPEICPEGRAALDALEKRMRESHRCAIERARRIGTQVGESFWLGNMFTAELTYEQAKVLAGRSDVREVAVQVGPGEPPP